MRKTIMKLCAVGIALAGVVVAIVILIPKGPKSTIVDKPKVQNSVVTDVPEQSSSKEERNKKTTKKNFPNIAFSAEIYNRVVTNRQLDGYYWKIKKHKNFNKRNLEDLDCYYDMIVSEDGKVVYKKLLASIDVHAKYKNKLFFVERTNYNYEQYKSFDMKTGETQVIVENVNFSAPPMIYKDRIYYVQGGMGGPSHIFHGDEGDTPYEHISIKDLNGKLIENIKIKSSYGVMNFLGIAYDKIYYVDRIFGRSRIKRCNLDGSEYEIVAKDFKLRQGWYPEDTEKKDYNISYDESGWYFIGGTKRPHRDLCKFDFKTNKATIIKKNFCKKAGCPFDAKDGKVYYRNDEDYYLYCLDTKTGNSKLIVAQRVKSDMSVSGNYLYYKPVGEDDIRMRIKIADTGKYQEAEMI